MKLRGNVMTQEELDSLMAGDLELDSASLGKALEDEYVEEEQPTHSSSDNKMSVAEGVHYRVSADSAWPPPPPTDDHKVVNQLDDVTKDSEQKATEMFDKLESISSMLGDIESKIGEATSKIDEQKALMTKLSDSFPKIVAFKKGMEDLDEISEMFAGIGESAINAQDEVMMAMDMMQYQDIHRQKIERVINVMRALSKYMNSLFEGRIEDSKRVASATHIHGDVSTEEVVSEDDIEALIASLGKKV